MKPTMTTTEAVHHMRADPAYHELVVGSYLLEDAAGEVARFTASVEWRETLDLLPALDGATVLDLGAGSGLASRAFATTGAGHVVALEPGLDDVVGLGVLRRSAPAPDQPPGAPLSPLAAFGGAIPLASESVDVVYCRQVLHHIPDLHATMAECARVLRPGGHVVATREHVVDDDAQLAAFQAAHPVHQLAGGESAWSLDEYCGSLTGAGLELQQVLGPWDAVINAYPAVTSEDELARAPEVLLGRRAGALGARLGALPGVRQLVWRRLRRPAPGRLYSFVARKPTGPPPSTSR